MQKVDKKNKDNNAFEWFPTQPANDIHISSSRENDVGEKVIRMLIPCENHVYTNVTTQVEKKIKKIQSN